MRVSKSRKTRVFKFWISKSYILPYSNINVQFSSVYDSVFIYALHYFKTCLQKCNVIEHASILVVTRTLVDSLILCKPVFLSTFRSRKDKRLNTNFLVIKLQEHVFAWCTDNSSFMFINYPLAPLSRGSKTWLFDVVLNNRSKIFFS